MTNPEDTRHGQGNVYPLPASGVPDVGALFPEIDWHTAWSRTPEEIDWLVEPVIERGRLYSMYSPAKVGKSLITLEMMAGLATGHPIFGNPARDPMSVLYIDMENAEEDLVERLSAFGYGPDDLANLHYLSFPTLSALDSYAGGQQLLAAAIHYRAEVIVIDTLSRVIGGKENDSDTFAALYRNALAPLKGRKITVIRLDHAGKNEEQGQRASSAKATDVDVVWKLSKTGQTTFTLHRETTRNNHSPEFVQLTRRFSPLRHEITQETGLDPAVSAVVDLLAEHKVPLETGKPKCRAILSTLNHQCSNATLEAAIRHRKKGV